MPFSLTRLSAAALALAACGATPSQAADVPPGEDIVVTAARTALPASALPLTAIVIDAETLARQLTVSGSVVDAVSALVPSFSPARQKLTGQGETLRGRSPLFAIDGIPQTAPLRDGSRDGFTIDPFFVDRVEIIQGSNALQGIGATGGVINQVTVGAPKADGWSGRVLVQGTAEDGLPSDGLGAKLAGLVSNRSGPFDITVGAAFETRGTYRDGKGRRIGVEATQGDLQDSRSLGLYLRAGAQLSETVRLELMAQRFDLKGNGDYLPVAGNRLTGVPTTGVRGKQPGEAPRNLAESAALTLTADDLAGGKLNGQIFWNRTADTYGGGVFADFQDPAFPPFGTLFDQSENRSRKIGGRLTYERTVPGFEALTALVGLDVLHDRTEQILAATGRTWVPQSDYRSVAPFAQLNLALLDERVRLSGGLRHEDVTISIPDYTTLWFYGPRAVGGGSPSFAETLPNGGIVVEPWKGIRAYASYAEGYTVPDVGRITRAIREDGVDLDNFLDISPVIANNRELGVEIVRGPVQASAAYFWSTSNQGQLLVLVGDVFEVQRQRIEIEGLELNLRTATPIEGLILSLGYAHLLGRVDGDGDGVVDRDLDGANIGPDRLNLAADYRTGPLRLRLASQSVLARSFDGGDPRNNFGGYWLLDGFASLETKLGDVSLGVQNLLDRQYIDYNSDTQRPTDNLRFFAGRGRTVTLGLARRF